MVDSTTVRLLSGGGEGELSLCLLGSLGTAIILEVLDGRVGNRNSLEIESIGCTGKALRLMSVEKIV